MGLALCTPKSIIPCSSVSTDPWFSTDHSLNPGVVLVALSIIKMDRLRQAHEARDFSKHLPTDAYLSDQLLGLTGERRRLNEHLWTSPFLRVLTQTQSTPKD